MTNERPLPKDHAREIKDVEMIEHKHFVQRIGLVGLTNLIVYLTAIFLLPILTKTLPIAEYGIWAQISVSIVLIPSIVMCGLYSAMVRFLAGAKRRQDVQDGFYSIAFVVFVLSAIASLLLFIFSKSIAAMLFDHNQSITRMLSLIIFIECQNIVFLSFFQTFQQIKKYSIFIIIQTCLSYSLVTYFVLSCYGIVGAITGILLARFILFLVMGSLIVSMIGVKVPKFTNIKDYLAFGLPTVPANLSSWVINSSDRYIISILLGTAFVGYYSPGYILGDIIRMFISPFGLILPAILSKYYDEDEMGHVKMILKYSLKYFLMFAIPSSFGVSLLSKPLLVILSTPEIASEAYLITPFVAVSAVFFGTLVIVNHILLLKKKTAITGSIYIFAAIMNFGLNIILIPLVGIIGAALATLVAYSTLFGIITYCSFKYIKFEIDFYFITKSIFASIVMSLVILKWNPEGLSNVIAAIGICGVVYAAVLLLLRGITKEEIIFFRSVFRI